MVQKIKLHKQVVLIVFVYICLFITSCTPDRKANDGGSPAVQLKVERFEQDLFNSKVETMSEDLHQLKAKYGSFFDLFAFQITRLGSRDSLQMLDNFSGFISDTNFRAVYEDCSRVFGDFSAEKEELERAFSNYSVLFPEHDIPQIITLLSVFSYPIIVDSATLAIALDMYLGTDCPYYYTLDPPLPLFLRIKMRKEYVVSDAMRGWLESDYGIDESTAKMVDMMISQGRVLCALDKILPDIHDTLKSGFSKSQLDWCIANESKIWSFFIENKLLFNNDPNLMQKYVSDGPTTNGFPKESPGNIGKFAGWMIVKSYLKNNKDVSLKALLEDQDLMKIFQQSKYKPSK